MRWLMEWRDLVRRPSWLCRHKRVVLVLGNVRPPFRCMRCGVVSWKSDSGPWEKGDEDG